MSSSHPPRSLPPVARIQTLRPSAAPSPRTSASTPRHPSPAATPPAAPPPAPSPPARGSAPTPTPPPSGSSPANPPHPRAARQPRGSAARAGTAPAPAPPAQSTPPPPPPPANRPAGRIPWGTTLCSGSISGALPACELANSPGRRGYGTRSPQWTEYAAAASSCTRTLACRRRRTMRATAFDSVRHESGWLPPLPPPRTRHPASALPAPPRRRAGAARSRRAGRETPPAAPSSPCARATATAPAPPFHRSARSCSHRRA